ncbi:MAG: HNH endonuclease [Pelagibacteraceae bacterium]
MPRNYKKEYENYHSKPEQKKDRAGRNGARILMKKKYGNSLLGRDVDHKDRNPRNNSMSNLRLQSKSLNRSRNQ